MGDTPKPAADRRPRALIAVDRGLAELRRGGVVGIRGPEGRVALALAAEMATADGLAELSRLSGSAPVLAVTGRRVASLTGRDYAAEAVHTLALPDGSSEILIRGLIDPTLGAAELDASIAVLAEPPKSLAAAAIQLAKLARLLPAMLIAWAPPAELDEMRRWARSQSLLLIERDDVAAYSGLAARRLTKVSEARVPLADAEDARIVAFRPLDGGGEHLAILVGSPDPAQPVLVRLHSQCFTGDLLGSLRCDCGDQLRGAIRQIAAAGSGIVLYLAQEGRDIGLVNKLRAYELQDRGFDTFDANEALGFEADERVFLPAAEMLRQLGIGQVRLLTNNPKKVEALAEAGVRVVDRVAHAFPSNGHSAAYLQAKKDRAGHLL
ncbi:MAG: GTP cyclohydrolase II [Alphaproteobacteria bacterium]|nr:GTP cyclohydrolase II [Alphaproteobacteria bacterium]